MIPKFKAWDKTEKKMYDLNEMIYEVSIDHPRVVFEMPFEMVGYDWKNHDFELLQWTGLKDCNGVEIYEGDIISYDYAQVNGYYVTRKHELEQVIFDTKCTGFKPLNSIVDLNTFLDNIEVIGNIYQNPELLKGE